MNLWGLQADPDGYSMVPLKSSREVLYQSHVPRKRADIKASRSTADTQVYQRSSCSPAVTQGMLSVLTQCVRNKPQALSSIAAASVGATRGKKSLDKRVRDAESVADNAEAEKKRRRRSEKAQLRTWAKEIQSYIWVEDLSADKPSGAQAGGQNGWQRLWRQSRSRRKPRNSGWVHARQNAKGGRDTWHEKAWGHTDSGEGARWGQKHASQEADFQQFQRAWQEFEMFWRQPGQHGFGASDQQHWRHSRRQQREQQQQQHHMRPEQNTAVAKHMRVLHIAAGQLDAANLKAAFHASARTWHPDLHEGDDKKVAEAKFKEALQSHEALRTYLGTNSVPDA